MQDKAIQDNLIINRKIEDLIINYIKKSDNNNIKTVFFTLLIENVLSLTSKNPDKSKTVIQDEELIKLIDQYYKLQTPYSKTFKKYILDFFYKEISTIIIHGK